MFYIRYILCAWFMTGFLYGVNAWDSSRGEPPHPNDEEPDFSEVIRLALYWPHTLGVYVGYFTGAALDHIQSDDDDDA